jgi:hypothetical protein
MLVISKSGRQSRYAVTGEDYLTLLRAVDREGPPKLGVAWTLLQRFGMLYPLYSNLGTFIQAYAQPINPLWFPLGPRHIAEVKRLGTDLAAIAKENQQAVLREKWAAVPYEAISADTKGVVASIFAGSPSPIPTSSHYAAPIVRTSVDAAVASRAAFAAKRNYEALELGDPTRSNWFYAEAVMSGVEVLATYGAATLAAAWLAIGVTTGAGLLALLILKKIS